jgi:hypothetical protein
VGTKRWADQAHQSVVTLMADDMTRAEARQIILNFLSHTGGRWDWDDFISVRLADPELEKVRVIAAELPDRFPPGIGGGYCGPEGIAILRKLADELA